VKNPLEVTDGRILDTCTLHPYSQVVEYWRKGWFHGPFVTGMIEITDSPDKTHWSEFVYNHPQGNIFQTLELAEVYKRTKNYEPIFSDLIQAFCASKPSMRIEIFLYAVVNFINAKYQNRSMQQMMFTYNDLLASFRKGLRNGNWRKLRRLEKALFQASLWYSRVKGTIINELVVVKLSVLVAKLKATKGARIFKRGYEKAGELLSKGEGIFAWATRLREWLKDPDYVFWLGAGGLRIAT